MLRFIMACAFIGLTFGTAKADAIPRYEAVGYCYNSNLGSAAGISSFTDIVSTTPGAPVCNGLSAAALGAYTYIVACAYGANINFLPAGTPTATIGSGGQQITQGSCNPLNQTNPGGLQFIQQSAGGSVGLMIYRVPGVLP